MLHHACWGCKEHARLVGPTLQWLVNPEEVVLFRLKSEASLVRPQREQFFFSTPSAACVSYLHCLSTSDVV